MMERVAFAFAEAWNGVSQEAFRLCANGLFEEKSRGRGRRVPGGCSFRPLQEGEPFSRGSFFSKAGRPQKV